ncbi:MAG: RNA polymerase sigma factor [Clostridia bacterium]|nr:RNA polymerase sigma factor [Clostridia bacterium]
MAEKAQVPGLTDGQEMLRLMDEHSAHLIGMCTLLLRDTHLAQDVVQETFIRAWKKGRLIHETERAWLTRVAVNLCRDEQRSRWFRHVDRRITPEELSIPADAPDADNDLLERVHQLPAKEREAIVLHYWNDMAPEDIAHMLNIDRATVFRRLARGRKRLKLEMEGGSEA